MVREHNEFLKESEKV